MTISNKIRTIFRGDVRLADLPKEALRRRNAADRQKRERKEINKINIEPARLAPGFATASNAVLLQHFRQRSAGAFWPLRDDSRQSVVELQKELFPDETTILIESADRIALDSKWPLMGFGVLEFASENCWRRDPCTRLDWGLDYHADLQFYRGDGSDVRILWELNRFGHAITLARAYALTDNETYAEAFLSQIASWIEQNPYGCGANWACAMEVALRAVNLLAAFDIFRAYTALTENRLASVLRLFDQHGRFIVDNSEFSYVATSNHYLSDVVGLFWIGTLVPELDNAAEWRAFGWKEILNEMDKQVHGDGSDFEASNGYHRFVTELFLYTFLLAERNGVQIADRYREKLRKMLDYLHAILRPDGRMPLIGDADGSQIVPVVKREGDDAEYLLSVGAALCGEQKWWAQNIQPEVLWLLGEKGISRLQTMQPVDGPQVSAAFPNAGAYVMRYGDLYLHFNANDCGLNGRGSHGHNDALSIEVSAFGRVFIVDPGSYAYNMDRVARGVFRSTAYHSTLQIDAVEQNTTDDSTPFLLGNEAAPTVLLWETNDERDVVIAEHYGYQRLLAPVTHRRSVEFIKSERAWRIEDSVTGKGSHKYSLSFHTAPDLMIDDIDASTLAVKDNDGNCLLIRTVGIHEKPSVIRAFVSRDYGNRQASLILNWTFEGTTPFAMGFLLVPVEKGENIETRLESAARLNWNVSN